MLLTFFVVVANDREKREINLFFNFFSFSLSVFLFLVEMHYYYIFAAFRFQLFATAERSAIYPKSFSWNNFQ
jgi:hypothetical protein